MFFKDVVGLQTTKQHLINLVLQARIPHAIMISGQKGNGGLPLAIAFAQFVMCENKQEADSCGTCPNCTKFSKLQHIDVHYSFPIIKEDKIDPVSNSYIRKFKESILNKPYLNITEWLQILKAENKQGNISAKECREVIKKLQMRSFEGGYKFLIMWLPEYLGKEGNILLKQIEEPSEKTIMIFVTENYEEVLSTIQSRVQFIGLPPLKDSEIYDALLKINVPEKGASQIARISEGNYNYALQSIDHIQNNNFEFLKEWLNVLFINNGIGINNWVLQIADQPKEIQKQFFSYVITMMEHLIRTMYVSKDYLLLFDEEMELITKLIAKNISEEKANVIAQLASDAIYALERNANSKIIILALSLQVKDIFAGKALYLLE